MHQYEDSGDEDGQLKNSDEESHLQHQQQTRTSRRHSENDDEDDTGDSLDIKPPQAKSNQDRKRMADQSRRYNSEKRNHSKEHRSSKEERQYHSGRHRDREGKQHNRPREQPGSRYEAHLQRDRENYGRHKGGSEQRRGHSRKNSPEGQSVEADRILEDLRSRLISRRQYDGEKERPEYYDHRPNEKPHKSKYVDQQHYEMHRREVRGKERGGRYEQYNREFRRDVVEVIDSPEYYQEAREYYQEEKYIQSREKGHRKDRPTIEDKEQIARRAKLIEAEREMARQKQLAREELENRRRDHRDRKKSESPDLIEEQTKRKKTNDERSSESKRRKHEEVVSLSDQSESEDEKRKGEEIQSDKDDNEDEEEEEEDSNSDSNSSDSEKSSANESEAEQNDLPGSPLSVGDLTKSDRKRHSQSRSRSLSRSVSRSRSRSESRSVSRSRSRTRSHSRTSSASPKSGDEEKRSKSGDQDKKEIEESVELVEELKEEEKKEELPSYFPALQGCRSVEEFLCLNRIEEGTYGVVYRAKDKKTDEVVALKRLKMEKEKEGFPITSLREINTLLKGQHPNIVTVREIVVGSNMDKIFIVMDYVEHDMKSLMDTMKHKKQTFLPGEVKCLLQQLLRAVAHLHDNWILHRDLKTSNLLLSHKGILKVGDFGLAREYGSPLKAYTSVVVTLWYRAPELLLCSKEYSTPIDVWSVGCIFAEFLSMTALFPGKSEIDQLNRIFKDLGTPNEKIWPGYSELPAVQKMTFTEYPVSQLRRKFSHFTSEFGLSLLQGLLTYDPKKRLTAEQALKNNYFKELPLPIDPAMFPTWPAKSELGTRKALASSPKPPSGGGQFKQLEGDDNVERGFHLGGNVMESRQLAMGPGFSLKF